MRRRAAAGAIAVLAAASPAAASGPGYVSPWTLDSAGGSRTDREALYAGGAPGVLLTSASPGQLFIIWRRLHGLPVGVAVGESLAVPCCGAPDMMGYLAENEWLDARKAVPGAAVVAAIQTDRRQSDGAFGVNCHAQAFHLAAATLKARSAVQGAASPWVKRWLDAQDAVFRGCSDDGVRLPPPSPSAPAWLVRDRAYQEAALALYQGRYGAAADGFEAIGRDPASPWRDYAPYLVARSRIRATFSTASAGDFAAARAAVGRLAVAPASAVGKADVPGLRSAIAFRERPAERAAELEAELSGPVLPATAAADFKDLALLADQDDGRSAIVDWIRTIKAQPKPAWGGGGLLAQARRDSDAREVARLAARAHALQRWSQTRDRGWLLAALLLSDRGEDGVGALLAAARAAPADAPAYLPLAWHRVRLQLGDGDTGSLRRELDAILARRNLSTTSRNLFVAERLQSARTLAEFQRDALRTRVCATAAQGCIGKGGDEAPPWGVLDGPSPAGSTGWGEDARALIDRMALSQREALAAAPGLPARLRLDLVLTDWTRAVLLGRDAQVLELTRRAAPLLPLLAADWRALLNARPGPERRFAEDLILAKVPGLATDLAFYVRPEGRDVADFQGGWPDWRRVAPDRPDPRRDAPGVVAYRPGGVFDGGDPALRRLLDGRADALCLGRCGSASFPLRMPEALRPSAAIAAGERGRFTTPPPPGSYIRGVFYRGWDEGPLGEPTLPAGSTSVWEELFAYASAHPDDPRSAEALHWLVHIGRYGVAHDHIGRRAFLLLHARHPRSVWAKRDTSYRT